MLDSIINELLYCLIAVLTAFISHAVVDSILLNLSIRSLWAEIGYTLVLWAVVGTVALKVARLVFEDEPAGVEEDDTSEKDSGEGQ